MKSLLYIGNQFNNKGNQSSIDILGLLFRGEGYKVFSASKKKNIVLRLCHMLWTCFKYKRKVDVVLIDTYSTLNFYYAFFVSQLCRLLKLRYIPILHGGNLPERLKKSPGLSKAIFNHAYKNVAPSEYMKSNFEDLGYLNIVCIPNSITLNNYTFQERPFDKVKLLWVRSLSKIYNPILAIKVLKALKDLNMNAELCMVGPDSDGSMQKVIDYAKELKVEVTFTGKLSKEEWIEKSKDYNIFINTTNFDNMPVSVIEAMALGLPIISTNVGGMPFLIEDGHTGILVEPDSVKAFIKAIKKLLNSPKESSIMALNARKTAEQLDWNVVKNQWFQVL
ncbi:glycosyltransferase family 4 protein [Flavivirga spongiicola]|uniref:Glycosyltransferase family 4 protein n=1 Tax=Flavivirga spongiicola TaxID=421621 RepID=A0ABU7XNJ7_9FLAO|nr:glycosyltransferase family 4 protein [Flavivirga sp. MEBiC05379]MDO5981682.1 glycosyltransferase family 4 protein [Flavivirga sp. MEBiC05379]